MIKTTVLTNGCSVKGGVLLLGGFDGLHVGHRLLLSHAKTHSLPVGVMTIVGGKGNEGLFTPQERESIFRVSGVDFIFELSFSAIKGLSPLQFLATLEREFSPAVLVAGEDFRFGKNAAGDVETLKTSTHVRVEIFPLVKIDGEKVSTTLLKRLLKDGKIVALNTLLGQEFFVTGTVQKDRQVGRRIGFPTANIAYPTHKCALKTGVYETRVTVDGSEYKAITNYGARPTFQNDEVWTESYLDGFSGDLYGRELTVKFVRYLREVQTFDGAESLREQLQKDVERVRNND